MKPSLIAKLERLVERRAEIERELSDASVIGDQEKFRRLSQEYAQLGPVADAFRRFRHDINERQGLLQMQNDPHRELAEMARADLPGVEARLAAAEQQLQKFLVPADPLDNNNVFLEIRAGTGGDEAAIFAGDLFRMYSRYAETRGWQVELISANPGEHGGYKEVISRIAGFGA